MKTCRFIITHRKGVCPLLRRRPGSQGTFKTCEYVPLCLISMCVKQGKGLQPLPPARETQGRDTPIVGKSEAGPSWKRRSQILWVEMALPPPLFVAIAEVEVENLLIYDRDENCVDGCEDSGSQVPCADGRHDCSMESCLRPSTWGANIRKKHTDVRPPTS